MSSLEKYASKHALPVTFLGNVRNETLPPLYRAADLFVTCSTSETFGEHTAPQVQLQAQVQAQAQVQVQVQV